MNIANNKRRKESQRKIEKAFVNLLQEKELSQITVTDICKTTGLNRTTFYNNYLDIYDLADKIRLRLVEDVGNLYEDERTKGYNSNDFSKIFRLIKENQLFFKTYFKLENDPNILPNDENFRYDTNLAKYFYNDQYIDYHIEFFRAGFNAILKKWLDNGCQESPEEMYQIIMSEYSNKKS